MTHICVCNLTIIGSDNGLSPGRRQAIIWTNAGILSIGPLGTNFNEISIGIQAFSFKKMHFKMSSAKWRPFCLSFNVLLGTVYSLPALWWAGLWGGCHDGVGLLNHYWHWLSWLGIHCDLLWYNFSEQNMHIREGIQDDIYIPHIVLASHLCTCVLHGQLN